MAGIDGKQLQMIATQDSIKLKPGPLVHELHVNLSYNIQAERNNERLPGCNGIVKKSNSIYQADDTRYYGACFSPVRLTFTHGNIPNLQYPCRKNTQHPNFTLER